MTKEDQNLIADKILSLNPEESKKYSNSKDFIELINSINYKDRTDKFKNCIIHLLEVEKDEEGYFLDAFDKRITYNGIKTLKKEGAKTKWSLLQQSEYVKCSTDFDYFFYGYCKIMTKKGYNFPEIRNYQERMIHGIKNYNRLLISYSRQMGKCTHESTFINIINNKTNKKETITVKEFHNRIKEENETI